MPRGRPKKQLSTEVKSEELPRDKWPRLIITRTASNGKQVSREIQCERLEIHEEILSQIVGSKGSLHKQVWLTLTNAEDVTK